jgi:hypothetical protein
MSESKNNKFGIHHIIWVTIVILSLSCNGCLRNAAQTQSSRLEAIVPSLQSIQVKFPRSFLDELSYGQDITRVDFMNFTYPVTEDLKEMLPSRIFSVVKGVFSFKGGANDTRVEIDHLGTVYDRVTGKENSLSAIVVFSVRSGSFGVMGSGRTHCVYIYNLSKGSLKLLWSFDTGDRSNGGLRNIYGENGNLIKETYSSDVGFAGACCAKTFMQSTYKWTGSKFQLIGSKRLNNPTGGASPVLKVNKQNKGAQVKRQSLGNWNMNERTEDSSLRLVGDDQYLARLRSS